MTDKFTVNGQEFECTPVLNGDNHYYLLDDNNIAEIEFGDSYPESPRALGYSSTFITFERNCESPDDNPFKDWEALLKHFDVELNEDNTKYMTSIANALREKAAEKGIDLLPVWKNEDTGEYAADDINPFPDAGYNSNIVGVIYDEGKDSLSLLEVDEYNQWVNDELYRYTIYDTNGNQIDTAGGYYDIDTVIETIANYNDAEPIQDLGCHADIEDCLKANREELFKIQNDIER